MYKYQVPEKDKELRSSSLEDDLDSLFAIQSPELVNMENFFRKYYEKHKSDYDKDDTKAPDLVHTMIHNNEEVKDDLSSWGETLLKSEIFFRNGHNISVVPHMRYSPVFLHSHDFFEITYSFSGNCRYYVDNRFFTIDQDCMALISPGIAHAVTAVDDRARIVNFLVRKEYFQDMLLILLPSSSLGAEILFSTMFNKDSSGYIFIDNKNSGPIRSILIELIRIYFSDSSYIEYLTQLKMQEFFLQLFESQNNTDILRSSAFTPHHMTAESIIRRLRNNYQTLDKSKLALEYGYSERQLSRILKSYTGSTFSELLQDFRMKDACLYLEKSALTLNEISEKLGFSNVSNFHQSFSKYFGTTPNKYRAAKHQE